VKISDVAKYVGLNRSYLTNIFKEKTGVSPQEYLIQCKLQMADKLLSETDNPIQEISRQVGYDNPLTFSKTFKKYYGNSPRAYREKKRKQT
jgi:AraC family transcriptional regulator of arabinose operon